MPNNKNLLFVDLLNTEEVEKYCSMLECSEKTLRQCVLYAGSSIVSIESFLNNNREWLEQPIS